MEERLNNLQEVVFYSQHRLAVATVALEMLVAGQHFREDEAAAIVNGLYSIVNEASTTLDAAHDASYGGGEEVPG